MKITYLSTSTIPSRTANSIHVMKMCQALAQEHHDVTLVAIYGQAKCEGSASHLSEHYGITQPFDVRRFTRWRILKLYDFNIRSASHAKRSNCNLVYARNIGAASYTAVGGIPTILECHSPIIDGRRPRREFLNFLRAPGFRRLVVITHALREHFLKEYGQSVHADDVVVAPDAVDLERFVGIPDVTVARKECGFPECFTVGYAGHLYPGRGVEMIYDLAQRFPHLNFLIIGGLQRDIEACQKEVEKQGLRNVVLKGFVPNKVLPMYMASCNILMMPFQRIIRTYGHRGSKSVSTAEWASPMKMFEYMAMRRLILASDLPVLREVLNETNSVLCDPENFDQWVAAVNKAQVDSEWAKRLSSQAFEDVQQYTWRKRVQRVLHGIHV